MPKATADVTSTKREELRSLPEGYVVLRRMTYGQQLERREMLKMTMATDESKDGEFIGEMALASMKITQHEYLHCIVDHNLEKELPDGTLAKLNFAQLDDFKSLDPRVGQEIEKFISDMNNFEKIEGN